MKTMMKSNMLRASTAALVAAAAMTFAAGVAEAGIANTKHNLSSSGTGTNHTTNIGQICVFCHTPHGSETSASVPLWNRKLPAGASFTTYDALGTSTLDGDILTVGSVSVACLSCHDGSQAMDAVVNAPGSGGYDNTIDGTTGTMGATWAGSNQITGGITQIGKDLQNDHPIGVQYGGFNPGSGQIDPDFVAPTKAAGSDVWWVDTTGGTASREKTDMILYTRDNSGNQPFVECASCHDPHSENATFLRIANTGSAVCLSCHTK